MKENEKPALSYEEKKGKRKKAISIAAPIVCACIVFVVLLTQVILPRQKLNKAMEMIDAGEYDPAYAILEELGNTEAITENKYDRAMERLDARDYEAAYALLEEIGNDETITASKYDRAMERIEARDYEKAYALLEEIGNNEAIAASKYDRAMERIDAQDYETALALLDGVEYKDSEAQRINAAYQYYKPALDNAAVGDTIMFGKYEQDNDTSNGKEKIEWLVLAKKDDRLLVVSQYALDCQQYNTSYTKVTWEDCTLREWLNEDFLNAAFLDGEKAMISTVTVPADKNPDFPFKANPGNDTQDKVFLLSMVEANEYFQSDEERMCAPTAYAKANGAYTSYAFVKTRGGAATCEWLLRSPGRSQHFAAYVVCDGRFASEGSPVSHDYYYGCCVRPAMWIDLGD